MAGLNKLFRSRHQTKSSSSSHKFPMIRGSLFVSKPDDPNTQKCIYLNCTATLRAVAKFSYDLYVSRTEDDDLSDSFFAADISFSIDPALMLDADEGRLCWSDRAGKRFGLDFENEDNVEEFLLDIARAMYEKQNKESAAGIPPEQLRELLHASLPVSSHASSQKGSDLLSTAGELMRKEGELFHYDVEKETFMPVCPMAITTINSAVASEDNSRSYLLMVFQVSDGARILEHEISNDMAPQFYTNTLSLVWLMNTNLDADDADSDGLDPDNQLCLSIKFSSSEDFVQFRNQFTVCLYEINHNARIEDMKLKAGDRGFIEDSLRDDIEAMDIDEDVSTEDLEESRQLQDDIPRARVSTDDWNNGELNSQLAVAYENDRTFVVRGNRMGVFKTGDDGADLQTTVKFRDPTKGDVGFTPSKMLLHQQDSSMLLLDKSNPSRVMRMDLERGEIVDTWKGDSMMGASVSSIQQTEKYSNLTHAQDFVGLNKNMLLRMDPRTNEFIVQSKKYAAGTRAKLECVATTGSGYLAVASEQGDIRLFDQIGKNAKTHLPGLGDKIIGIDVTEDGFFVLATTPKYLLIIDTRVKGQEKGGFEKSMGKNKPPPRKLVIKSQDIARHRMGEISFTAAHFNTGPSLERSIVTSTGPFIITWNFRAIKMGRLDSYQVKRFRDNIVADHFAYNDDGKIVVTLPNNVGVARR
eukprot:IDg12646t1